MNRLVFAILAGGLIAGALDIIYAFIVYGPLSYGMSPLQVLQSVAAGWIGRDAAMAGGAETATLGALSHFGIALIMASVFVLAAQAMPSLRTHAIVSGLIYGVGLYVAMNYFVGPLSAAGAAGHFVANGAELNERLARAFSKLRPDDPEHAWMLPATIFTHTVLVGLPISLSAKRLAS
jgi:uncharacterized membrane protein YagU involved in acid resistance